MKEHALDALIITDVKITWKTITSTKINTTALKKEFPEVVAMHTQPTTRRKFCVQRKNECCGNSTRKIFHHSGTLTV